MHQPARYTHGGLIFEPRLKSNRIRRTAFPSTLTPVLQERRRRQLEWRLAAGPAWHDLGLVFTRRDGWPIRHDTTLNHLRAALNRAGLPPMRFHDLRHSAASLLIALGTPPKEVSQILGPSTIGITMDLYCHMFPGAEKPAADRVDAALFQRQQDNQKDTR